MKAPDETFLREVGMTAEEFKALKRRNRRQAFIWLLISLGILFVGVHLMETHPLFGTTVGVISLMIFFPCLGVLFGW